MAAVRRLEDGERMPVLASRKSKRRFLVDSGVKRANTPTQEGWRRKAKRSRQREFVNVGADAGARHRETNGNAVSEKPRRQAVGSNLSTRRP